MHALLIQQLRYAADIGSDDRASGCDRLDHDVGTPLRMAREAKNVARGHPGCNFRRGQPSREKVPVPETRQGRHSLRNGPVGALADQRQA